MASEFQSNFKIVKDIFLRADALKFKLSKIILNGSDEDLKNWDYPAAILIQVLLFLVF